MYKLRIIAAIIIFPLLVSLAAQANIGQSRKKRLGAAKRMETVSIGDWGGQHVQMEVSRDGAQLDFDCAHATISQPLKLDRSRRFDVKGFYAQEHGGPIRADEDQNGSPARFKGSLNGKTLTLMVTLEGSAESIGPFTLRFGQAPRIVKCL
ncbi:MAG TPA: hypothetical protein VF658_11130 [Pyrinomonadaceae bacterium]|jgi:hypothetical protein